MIKCIYFAFIFERNYLFICVFFWLFFLIYILQSAVNIFPLLKLSAVVHK